MNPVAANTWIWVWPLGDDGLRSLVPKVRALGFDAIEFPVENAGEWDPGLAAELLAQHGLGSSLCAAFPPGRDLLTDADTLRSTQEFLRTCVDIAVRIGAPAVGGPMYSAVGRTWLLAAGEWATVLARLVAALRPIVDYAGEHGVTLALEPLNRYETSLINTVEQGLEVVAAVDSPTLGLLLDTYHMNIEEKDPAPRRSASQDRTSRTCTRRRATGAHPAPTTSTGRRSRARSATCATREHCASRRSLRAARARRRRAHLAARGEHARRSCPRRARIPPHAAGSSASARSGVTELRSRATFALSCQRCSTTRRRSRRGRLRRRRGSAAAPSRRCLRA